MTGTTPEAAIDVIRLTKRYRRAEVLREVSFTVPRGRTTALLGPNGAGKSTVLRGIVGHLTPTSGTVTVLGRPVRDLPRPATLLGSHFDGTGFETGLSARRHLLICAAAAGVPASRVDEVIDVLGLGSFAGRHFGRLSTGMKQRLGFAAAIIGSPDVLVLDEPLNGLDQSAVALLLDYLERFRSSGGAVLVASHHLEEMQEIMTDVVVIDRSVLFAGTAESMLARGSDIKRAFREILLSSGEGAAHA